MPGGRGLWSNIIRVAKAQPLAAIGAIIVLALSVIAVFGPWIAPYSPLQSHGGDRLVGPSGKYLFGTDNLGRDQFSRLVIATRAALTIAIVSVLIGSIVGALIGLASGYWGGVRDLVIQRIMDALLAIPTLILALAMVTVLGPSDSNVGIAITVLTVPVANRLVRATTLSVKNEIYIEAAAALGASSWRIMGRHIAPNTLGPLIALVTNQIPSAIITAASLSFLGLGTPPPAPSWGTMLSVAVQQYARLGPWLAISTGGVIFVTVLSFTAIGDALGDLMDPRLRSARRYGPVPKI